MRGESDSLVFTYKEKTFSFDFLLVMFLFCKNRKYIVSCIKRSVYLSSLFLLSLAVTFVGFVVPRIFVCFPKQTEQKPN